MFLPNERIKCISPTITVSGTPVLEKNKIYTVDYITNGPNIEFCYTKELFGVGFRVDRFKKLSWWDKLKEDDKLELLECIPTIICILIMMLFFWFKS